MMDPLPNCFSICARARSIALFFSAFSSAIHLSIFSCAKPAGAGRL
jgi:hypothetical protein